TYFVVDLIGCETFDTNGKAYGKLTDVLETGANDVYEIDGGKLLVPALKKVLHEVDIERGRIVFEAAVLEEVGCFAD
ncbi:MAG: PRC-barrel domain-containing protein, partial [Eubacteriales bacterium]